MNHSTWQVIGEGQAPSLQHRSKMPYVEATLHEVLRIACIGKVLHSQVKLFYMTNIMGEYGINSAMSFFS